MDVSAYMDLNHAARVVFNALPARRSRVRFMVPSEDGSDWRAITWGAFAAEIEQIGAFLAGAGLKSSERAAILGHNRVAWLSAALAIQGAGGAMVPIYPSSTADQVAYVVEHSDARVLFVDDAASLRKLLERWEACAEVIKIVALGDDLDPAAVIERMRADGVDAPSFSEVEPRFVTWSRARALGRSRLAESPDLFYDLMDRVSLDQPAVMLYTSGTTGRPKGVPLTHRNIGVNGRDWLQCNAPLIEEGYVDMLWLPLSHIFGFGEACLGNTLGFVTYWVQPHRVLDMLPVVRPQVFMSVPRVFEKLAMSAMGEPTVAAQRAKLDAVTGGDFRFCLSGGAGLKREVKDFFYAHDTLIIEGYGLTEASPTLTLNRADAFRFDSVGKPLPSVEIKLAEDGEILARGESIFGGYHKNPGATKETFTEDGWLLTGDIGRWTDDGFLQIIDRKKEIIVTAQGKNIPPANIEVRFADDPFVAHAVVYGDAKPYLVAGIWLDEAAVGAHLDDQGVTGEAARREARRALVAERVERANDGLARFETVKKFAIIDEPLTVEGGLLTPTLKVKRKKVYEAHGDTLRALYDA
jgi:long-chain acyl-CoA synthetase